MSPAPPNKRQLSMNQNRRRGRRPENIQGDNVDSEMPPPIPRNTKGAVDSQHSRHSNASSSLPKDDASSSDGGFNLKDADLHIERLTGTDHNRTVIRRRPHEVHAMSNKQRWELRRKRWMKRLQFWNTTDGTEGFSDEEKNIPQYRLEGTRKGRRFRKSLASLMCGNTSSSGGIGISHNQRLASTLHWMFRVNFLFLFTVMSLAFFGLVLLFSFLIISAGELDPDCIKIGGISFGNTTASYFADAFALSWTTLSTVGYGSTYPALGHENTNATNCLYITTICSLESFIGVLYSGFCGAILFGKVLRIQSHAQVEFSDPIVIRYGNGIEVTHHDDDEDDNDDVFKIPCPVLEFRVVNKLFAEDGGEIMDGTLTVVANVDANDFADDDPGSTDHSVGERSQSIMSRSDSFNSKDSRKPKRRRSTTFGALPSGIKEIGSGIGSGIKNVGQGIGSGIGQVGKGIGSVGKVAGKGIGQGIGHIGYGINQIGKISGISELVGRRDSTFDEQDPTAKLANKRMFSKMIIETSDHPFFKRVWVGRHVLDDTSPIVKPKVKRQIRRNKGYWPARLNNHDAVRDSLQFNQILVSLNGVANVSASDVYAQKIYDFVDVNIGYQFVNIIYKDKDNSLKLDIDLLNDVREQNGGGGEPLLLGIE